LTVFLRGVLTKGGTPSEERGVPPNIFQYKIKIAKGKGHPLPPPPKSGKGAPPPPVKAFQFLKKIEIKRW